ncbi:MAG: TetR/AcrR family transcriptional regulator [Syntrophobacteraceae bacterium]
MDSVAPAHPSKLRREAAAPESPVRDRIVSGARRHFFTHGLRSVTMDDLAKELGMSKKTLYAHFPSKTVLVETVLLDKFQEIEAELERITSELSSDVPAALQQLLACFQRHTDEIQPPFFRDIQREAPGMFELIEMRRRAMVQRTFGRFLTEGCRAGIIRDDISVEMMVEILLGAVQAIMNPPKMTELGLTIKSGFLTIITVFLEGVVTEQGRSKL